MRVALVIERFEPGSGGAENVAWQVAHGLAEAGDEVHVVARRIRPTPVATFHPVRVPESWQALRVAAFSRAAQRVIAAQDFDVVHAFSRTRHQHVFHAGGGSHADYIAHSYGRLGRRLKPMEPRHAVLLHMERRIFADEGQWVQCVSQMVKREIESRYGVDPRRLVVIPNGVDASRFHPERYRDDGAKIRSELSVPREVPVWLLAGSGWRRKGLDTALRALAVSQDTSTRLWVAGADKQKPWRRRAAELGVAKRVDFLGVRSDLERVLIAADALFLPTRYDAFGMVCLEAAAAARPVVTSGRAGSIEVLGEGALVVDDPEDAAGFAAALDRLSDRRVREAMGARGRDVALACSWEQQVEALRALYHRAAQLSPARAAAGAVRAGQAL